MVKLASIDLGSNSTRILIADVNDEKFDVLERMHVVTKMSENIEQSKETVSYTHLRAHETGA